MIPLAFVDPAIMSYAVIAGAVGSLPGLVCLLALRKQRLAAEKIHATLRAEIRSILLEHEAQCAGHVEQLGRNMAVLELRAQNVAQYKAEAGNGGLSRSARSQAMQLLRTGMSPDRAASTMGIGRREMRLIAGVARALSL